jgi:hypothetical protein
MRGLSILLLAAGLTSLAWPASARPRDMVLAKAYRCASIGASARWLDCYYGAAQPVRAGLNLVPAPEAQLRLLEDPPAGSAQDQAIRDNIMAAAARCGGEERAWLSCYYAAAARMRVALHLDTPSGRFQAAPSYPQSVLEEPPRGDWLLGSDRAMVAPMVAYRFNREGAFTVTMANGRVWRQLPGDVSHPRLKKPAHAYIARITRGALGSTNLSIAGMPGLYRVEQVQ